MFAGRKEDRKALSILGGETLKTKLVEQEGRKA